MAGPGTKTVDPLEAILSRARSRFQRTALRTLAAQLNPEELERHNSFEVWESAADRLVLDGRSRRSVNSYLYSALRVLGVSRPRAVFTCSICKQKGHNARTCTWEPPAQDGPKKDRLCQVCYGYPSNRPLNKLCECGKEHGPDAY